LRTCIGKRIDQARKRRADDARAIDHRAVERDCVWQILAIRHLDHEGLPRRHLERRHHPAKRGDGDDLPRLHQPAPGKEGKQQRKHHREHLRYHEHGPLRVAIGDPASERRKKKHRSAGRRRNDPEQRRRAGELIDQPAFGSAIDPIPNQRDQLPAEKEPVISMPERRKHLPPARCASRGV
jgi:hypothetical protein